MREWGYGAMAVIYGERRAFPCWLRQASERSIPATDILSMQPEEIQRLPSRVKTVRRANVCASRRLASPRHDAPDPNEPAPSNERSSRSSLIHRVLYARCYVSRGVRSPRSIASRAETARTRQHMRRFKYSTRLRDRCAVRFAHPAKPVAGAACHESLASLVPSPERGAPHLPYDSFICLFSRSNITHAFINERFLRTLLNRRPRCRRADDEH